MTSPEPKPSHHHGNLRSALVEAGLDILAEKGLAGLTLRACAARAGVSHAAPAHHFRGLDGLLAAIAAQGYARFTEAMLTHRDKAGPDARARLIAICEGYMAFVQASPALFQLIFSRDFGDSDDPDLEVNSVASFQVLAETCAPFKPPDEKSAQIELMIWSLVHGLANLRLAGCTGPPSAEQYPVEIRDILPELPIYSEV
jgi:AcrR family transcriptional regulator